MAIFYKALVGFTRLKDDELMVLARTVLGAMTDNANFATPTPSLQEVEAVADEFASSLAAARRRGAPSDTALKNEKRIVMEAILQKLGNYVNGESQGRLSSLLSSGFATNGPSSTIYVPSKVEAVRLSDGRQSGQMRLDFAPQREAMLYEYQFRTMGDPEWSERFTTTSSRANIIAPLPVAQYCEARVRGINSRGMGDWSDIATILVR
ncbi:hypothetical protein [Sphingobacterium griseoflavum]|uniref:Fibronectin type-III domain-containing protein n=1 Tax=Sphingobacterium griseoflavum TaxID=1474952 RepID=A0ABQ3I2W9_9SPHI|nr:hypothetical protein [Sphingobacterium griseoflavum]GHE49692.1 hypothetical protein GCM10017764_35920 [Sphingobacterium griseoflavum]